jgi:hypothetical protein
MTSQPASAASTDAASRACSRPVVVERDVTATLHTPGGVPVGLAVADEGDRHAWSSLPGAVIPCLPDVRMSRPARLTGCVDSPVERSGNR